MEIKNIDDKSFKKYGCVIHDDFADVLNRLKRIEKPTKGVKYVASVDSLEASSDKQKLEEDYFGGQKIQIGYCAGYNKVVNALEYHKSSEINAANEDFILVLGLRQDIIDNTFDLAKAEAFLVPKGTAVEIYATTLHYCPISEGTTPFNMLVVLPKETNLGKRKSEREPLLYCTNKWLIAYEDTGEAKDGAYPGLKGEKIRIE